MMKCAAVSARFNLGVLAVQTRWKCYHWCWLPTILFTFSVKLSVKDITSFPSSGVTHLWGQCESSRCENNLWPTYSYLGPLFPPCLNLSFIVPRWLKRSRGTEQLWHYGCLAELQSQLVRHRRQEWATRERHFPQERNPPHTTIRSLVTRRVLLHLGGEKIYTNKGVDLIPISQQMRT